MTAAALDLVAKLQQFDTMPPVPRVNIHLMATAPGNEHLLAFMTGPVSDPAALAGRRIAIVATHGAEEAEVTIPRKWLSERGAIVDIVSPRPLDDVPRIGGQSPKIADTHILLIQFLTNSGWMPVDRVLEEVSVDEYDAVIVPGGAWNPDQLRINPAVLEFLRAFASSGKPLGAICHAPVVLINAKLVKGRTVTGFWAIQEDLANAGATVVEEPVAVDGNIVTGRFIYDIPQFVEAIVGQLQ